MIKINKMKYYVKASFSYSDGWGGNDTDYYEGILELSSPVTSVDELKESIKETLKVNVKDSRYIKIITMVPIP